MSEIYIYGSSTMYGIGDPLGGMAARMLVEQYERFENRGEDRSVKYHVVEPRCSTAETIEMMYDKVRSDTRHFDKFRPDSNGRIAVLAPGYYDACVNVATNEARTDENTYIKFLNKIIDRCLDKEVEPYITGIAPLGTDEVVHKGVERYAERKRSRYEFINKQAALSRGLPYIDLYQPVNDYFGRRGVRLSALYVGADQIHPSKDAYDAIYARIAGVILPAADALHARMKAEIDAADQEPTLKEKILDALPGITAPGQQA